MPFNNAVARFRYGLAPLVKISNTYCVNNTSASDYGNCYNIVAGQAIFVQTDTTTYPTLPCQSNNTCIRYTNIVSDRNIDTIFNYTGKQAIIQFFRTRSHSSSSGGLVDNVTGLRLVPIPAATEPDLGWFLPAVHYELSSWPVYDPVSNINAYFNPYTITSGNVSILSWSGSYFTTFAYILVSEAYYTNIWYAFEMRVVWAYEASPLALIPLDYDRDYVPYQELRNAFGYAATGVDQPGWNADDIIRVLRELFPDRAWAVFDDRQYVLYLYNLTPDYVPDWLIERLTPTAMKVLKAPADVAVAKAWLDLLNERNAQIPPQAELP
jgi:hypothetical protein